MEDRIYSNGLKLVYFYLEGCEPCVEFAPIMKQAEETFLKKHNFEIIKVSIEENEQLGMQFGIIGFPSILIFKDGRQKVGFGGAPIEIFEEIVEAVVNGTDLPVPPELTEEEIAAMEAEMEAEMKERQAQE